MSAPDPIMDPSIMEYIVPFGPDSNCTLALCPLEDTVYTYRPSLAANIVFAILFSLLMFLHIFQGIRYRTWFFLGAIICGCLSEVIGYGGRIILWQNPFSFTGFMIQICCITFAPAFYCAAIYVTLTKVVKFLDPSISWFPPRAYYWVFIPCDLISLVLQAVGGATSVGSSGSSQTAVDISIAGLSFQVGTLFIFCVIAGDYAIRYYHHRQRTASKVPLPPRFKLFVACLTLSILLIFARCAYRIDELRQGYHGIGIITKEGPFIGLEGVIITIAVLALSIGHPGPAFQTDMKRAGKNASFESQPHKALNDPETGKGSDSDSSAEKN